MKKLICLAMILLTVTGLQLATLAAPAHKHPTKVIAEPLYNVNISAGAWEGVQVLVKLTLAGHTVMKNSPASSEIFLRVNGLKSGIYTATVSLLKTDLLNVDQRNQIQTILEYIMRGYSSAGDTYGHGCAIAVISIGDYTYPNTSLAIPGFYDLSMAWGKDVSQIPELPLGKLPFGRYRIGDTCKIVFFVGPPNTTIQDIEALQVSGAPKQSEAPSKIKIDFGFISDREGGQHLTGYVPNAQNSISGVTIATGVDIGQYKQSEINGWNVPASLKGKLLPYASPLTGQAAQDLLNQQQPPLTITKEEANALDVAVQQGKVDALVRRYNSATSGSTFAQLPTQAQTVIASVAFQYEYLPKSAPKFWSDITHQQWQAAVTELRNFGDSYPTRRNKEADLLQSAIEQGVLK